MTKLRLFLAATVAAIAVAPAAGAAELVINGTFEAGATGFHSDYAYRVGDFWAESTYGVDNNPHDGHGLFSSFGDHTSGQGLMMVVNGSGAENAVVWGHQSTGVQENETYSFSFWIASAHPDAPARLGVRINGDWLMGEAQATATTGAWQQFTYSWNSGAATTAQVELINRNLAAHGNDFALDDISFNGAAVPEPATWAMMIMGFGAVGSLLRRRQFATVVA